jgi:hypothetical protein
LLSDGRSSNPPDRSERCGELANSCVVGVELISYLLRKQGWEGVLQFGVRFIHFQNDFVTGLNNQFVYYGYKSAIMVYLTILSNWVESDDWMVVTNELERMEASSPDLIESTIPVCSCGNRGKP